MKIRLSGVPVGTCFTDKHGERKKVAERKVAKVRANGRVSMRKIKGDPEVEPTPCSLRLFGVGLARHHPQEMVEIGDGNPLKKRDRR